MYAAWLGGSACLVVWTYIRARLRRMETVVPCLDAAGPAPRPRGPLPFVSIIMPARNEETELGACVRAALAQDYPQFEVLVVDDESSDRTAAVAREALSGDSRGRFIAGARRPSEDWVGKSWAVTQGYRAARGDWLLFVDGDVALHPAALRRAVEKGWAAGVDVVSLLPAIEARSIWENLVMPLLALLTAMMKPPDRANRLTTSASRLSGAFLLIRREAYVAVGGHEAVRGEILEDMAMAESMKRSGRPVCLAYTHDLASTHLYATFHEMWEGLTRIGFPMLGYSVTRLAGSFAAAAVGTLAPWLLVGWGALAVGIGRAGGLPVFLLGALLVELMARTVRVVTRHIGLRRRYSYLLPAASAVLCVAAGRSALRHFAGRGLSWKERTYRLRPPRAFAGAAAAHSSGLSQPL